MYNSIVYSGYHMFKNSQYELRTLSLPSTDEQEILPSQFQSAKVILVLFVDILHVCSSYVTFIGDTYM